MNKGDALVLRSFQLLQRFLEEDYQLRIELEKIFRFDGKELLGTSEPSEISA